jgi:hypothetical protein
MKTIALLFYWAARILATVIMLQTLYFKFTGAEESVFIFSKVGMEPWGRFGVGALELVASGLLLINVTAWLGAALALGLMGGAILLHLTVLGVSVRGDGGYLFLLAIIVSVCSLYVLVKNRESVRVAIKIFSR